MLLRHNKTQIHRCFLWFLHYFDDGSYFEIKEMGKKKRKEMEAYGRSQQ